MVVYDSSSRASVFHCSYLRLAHNIHSPTHKQTPYQDILTEFQTMSTAPLSATKEPKYLPTPPFSNCLTKGILTINREPKHSNELHPILAICVQALHTTHPPPRPPLPASRFLRREKTPREQKKARTECSHERGEGGIFDVVSERAPSDPETSIRPAYAPRRTETARLRTPEKTKPRRE